MDTIAPRALVLSLLGALTSGCAGHGVPVYIAPSNETIESGTEMSLSGDGQYVYIVNHSSVEIVVTGLRLTDCENIKNRCEVMRLRVPVLPGQRQSPVLVQIHVHLGAGAWQVTLLQRTPLTMRHTEAAA